MLNQIGEKYFNEEQHQFLLLQLRYNVPITLFLLTEGKRRRQESKIKLTVKLVPQFSVLGFKHSNLHCQFMNLYVNTSLISGQFDCQTDDEPLEIFATIILFKISTIQFTLILVYTTTIKINFT